MSVIDSVCVPIFGKTPQAFAQAIKSVPLECSLVELRIDSLENCSRKAVAEILSNCPKRSILTYRLHRDGGCFSGSIEQRNNTLESCLDLDFDYLDIEIEQIDSFSHAKLLDFDKLIVSYHNFEQTPDIEQLVELSRVAAACKARIFKVATKINSKQDLDTLYSFLAKRIDLEIDTDLIVVGMGELGRSSRVIAPFLGSKVTYSLPIGTDNPIAIGQFPADILLELLKSSE